MKRINEAFTSHATHWGPARDVAPLRLGKVADCVDAALRTCPAFKNPDPQAFGRWADATGRANPPRWGQLDTQHAAENKSRAPLGGRARVMKLSGHPPRVHLCGLAGGPQIRASTRESQLWRRIPVYSLSKAGIGDLLGGGITVPALPWSLHQLTHGWLRSRKHLVGPASPQSDHLASSDNSAGQRRVRGLRLPQQQL